MAVTRLSVGLIVRYGWRLVRLTLRRLGIIGLYFTTVYFLFLYVMISSLDTVRQIEPEYPRKIPVVTMATPVTPPMRYLHREVQRSYKVDVDKFPMDIDIKAIVEDTIRGKDFDKYDNIEPINQRQFKYIHSPKKCKFDPDLSNKLLILVKSAAWNRELRKGIRKTWASGFQDGRSVKVVFLLASTEEEVQIYIDYEAKKFKDILQEDFIDAYRNNTYKTMMAFNWAVEYCPSADFLFFVDDDHYVHTENLTLHIKHISMYPKPVIDNLYIGFLIPCGIPYRSNSSKWYISYDEYPYAYWPPYLAGGAFIMSRISAWKFQIAMQYVHLVTIDDSYLGIVAKKLGIRPIDHILYHVGGEFADHSLLHHANKGDDKNQNQTSAQEKRKSFSSNTYKCF